MGRKLEDRSNRTWPWMTGTRGDPERCRGEIWWTRRLVNHRNTSHGTHFNWPFVFQCIFQTTVFISVQHFLCSFSILSIITLPWFWHLFKFKTGHIFNHEGLNNKSLTLHKCTSIALKRTDCRLKQGHKMKVRLDPRKPEQEVHTVHQVYPQEILSALSSFLLFS